MEAIVWDVATLRDELSKNQRLEKGFNLSLMGSLIEQLLQRYKETEAREAADRRRKVLQGRVGTDD